jgi:hypothetical protein
MLAIARYNMVTAWFEAMRMIDDLGVANVTYDDLVRIAIRCWLNGKDKNYCEDAIFENFCEDAFRHGKIIELTAVHMTDDGYVDLTRDIAKKSAKLKDELHAEFLRIIDEAKKAYEDDANHAINILADLTLKILSLIVETADPRWGDRFQPLEWLVYGGDDNVE